MHDDARHDALRIIAAPRAHSTEGRVKNGGELAAGLELPSSMQGQTELDDSGYACE